jgi:hypothetical protein
MGHDHSNVSSGNQSISVLIRDGALPWTVGEFSQGSKFLCREPQTSKAWFGFSFAMRSI